MELSPYFSFAGNAEEALEFYKRVLDGEVVEVHRYVENPEMCKNLPVSWGNKIMHASFKAGKVYFMASDVMPGDDGVCGVIRLVPEGSPITLALNFNSEAEEDEVFNRLALGGVVTMPLQDTFWGAKFGMLTDKFGMKWMFNCDKAPSGLS